MSTSMYVLEGFGNTLTCSFNSKLSCEREVVLFLEMISFRGSKVIPVMVVPEGIVTLKLCPLKVLFNLTSSVVPLLKDNHTGTGISK